MIPNNMHSLVKRAFGEHPLRDARKEDGPIEFKVTAADWKLGVRNDPNNCAYARALKRSLAPLLKRLGSLAGKGVAIYKQIAYVPALENGRIIILRYRLTTDVHAKWDKGVKPPAGAEMKVKVVPPTASQQLEAKRIYSRVYAEMKRDPDYEPRRRLRRPMPGSSLFHVRGNLYHHHSCIAEPTNSL